VIFHTKQENNQLIDKFGIMAEINKRSRIAGLLYLGVVLTRIFSLMFVPSKLINYDNAVLTFQNISTSETLFRYGIASGLLCYIFFLFLVLKSPPTVIPSTLCAIPPIPEPLISEANGRASEHYK
jgi:hypothetical protein